MLNILQIVDLDLEGFQIIKAFSDLQDAVLNYGLEEFGKRFSGAIDRLFHSVGNAGSIAVGLINTRSLAGNLILQGGNVDKFRQSQPSNTLCSLVLGRPDFAGYRRLVVAEEAYDSTLYSVACVVGQDD